MEKSKQQQKNITSTAEKVRTDMIQSFLEDYSELVQPIEDSIKYANIYIDENCPTIYKIEYN